jgi:hypothetical protein
VSIYLIPLEQAGRVKDVSQDFWAEAWESHNPNYPEGAWATPETFTRCGPGCSRTGTCT